MRKLGLFAVLLGVAILALDVLLQMVGAGNAWMWLPGTLLAALGGSVVLWLRWQSQAGATASPPSRGNPMTETARLLDNFEQRFAELKARNPNTAVLGDLYALATQLERRGRTRQATAVYRHLVRIDSTYLDVAPRLNRLMDAERVATRASGMAGKATAVEAAAGVGRLGVSAVGGAPTARATLGRGSQGMSVPPTSRPPEPPVTLGLNGISSDVAPATAPSALPAAAKEGEAPPIRQLGRYRIEREIGRGAMGVVYLGRDTAINRLVALKAIPLAVEFSDSELHDARLRFFREAETAGRLNHPNIVTIYDVGEEGGLAYIAMEHLKGTHLSDFTSSARLLEPRKILELIGRTADALGFAHKQQVVHRDIKPANLMYDSGTDILKITDFGIARIVGAGSTRTGIVLGTPSFMSPEQLEGRIVTGHSDLFSLGVSLFQLLTGQLPFTADSMTGLMQQIAEAPHPPLRAFRPDLPACVETVIDRALAKDPESRFDTGAQMAAALEDCRVRIPSGMP
jgi:serine/threonine-protein kinase